MLTSLSKQRLIEHSSYLGSVDCLEGFEMYKSHSTALSTQYYLVEKGWKDEPTRVEPLAHIHVLPNGEVKLKVFQPVKFGLYITESDLLAQFKNSLH